MEHFRCNRDSSKIHATFSNPTLPMLIKPIPISSRDTPRTFFVNAGISISSPSPSTNMTPLENNKTLRFASKYLDKIFAKEIPLHSKTSVPNRFNPLVGFITSDVCSSTFFITFTFSISETSER